MVLQRNTEDCMVSRKENSSRRRLDDKRELISMIFLFFFYVYRVPTGIFSLQGWSQLPSAVIGISKVTKSYLYQSVTYRYIQEFEGIKKIDGGIFSYTE